MSNYWIQTSLCFALAASTLASGGCKKKVEGESGVAAQPATASATGNPLMDKAVATGNPQAVVQAFNQLIEARFMVATTPLTSLDQLVKEGTLKAIPSGPDGRTYVFDPIKRQAVLR